MFRTRDIKVDIHIYLSAWQDFYELIIFFSVQKPKVKA